MSGSGSTLFTLYDAAEEAGAKAAAGEIDDAVGVELGSSRRESSGCFDRPRAAAERCKRIVASSGPLTSRQRAGGGGLRRPGWACLRSNVARMALVSRALLHVWCVMELTEVRINLCGDRGGRLKAFCSLTFDNTFVIRDVKLIDGNDGLFLAMPSRKLCDHCPSCGDKNHLRARFCNNCGRRLSEDRYLQHATARDGHGHGHANGHGNGRGNGHGHHHGGGNVAAAG